MLSRCTSCSRHVRTASCPFCGHVTLSKARAPGKNGVAVAAAIAAMGATLGCAYGLPPDYYDRDASRDVNTPDVSVSDGSRDAPGDSPSDAPTDAPVDASADVGGDAKDAALDAPDGG